MVSRPRLPDDEERSLPIGRRWLADRQGARKADSATLFAGAASGNTRGEGGGRSEKAAASYEAATDRADGLMIKRALPSFVFAQIEPREDGSFEWSKTGRWALTLGVYDARGSQLPPRPIHAVQGGRS